MMKKKFLYIGLSSLFLLGCSKKVGKIDYDSVLYKINNQEDFIVVLSSDTCGHCKNLKKTYNESKYSFQYYEIDFVKILEGIGDNDEKSIESYKNFANITEYAFSNIKSYSLDDTYGNYLSNEDKPITYKDQQGSDYYIEGYVNLATPLSYFFKDGELVNFEYGDYSNLLEKVMTKYENEIGEANYEN